MLEPILGMGFQQLVMGSPACCHADIVARCSDYTMSPDRASRNDVGLRGHRLNQRVAEDYGTSWIAQSSPPPSFDLGGPRQHLLLVGVRSSVQHAGTTLQEERPWRTQTRLTSSI